MTKCLSAGLLVGLLCTVAAGCGSKGNTACTGAERCACYPNATCNTGLTCLSDVCVNNLAGGGTGGSGARGTGGGTGAGGASTGGTGAGGGGGVGTGGLATGTGGVGVGGMGIGGGGGAATGTGGVINPGTGGTPLGAGTGGGPTSGGTGGGATGGGTGGNPDGGSCQTFTVKPEATVPTVFLLVDRSGSMFQCLTTNPDGGPCDISQTTWGVLKTSVLKSVQDLQSVVRFGFGAFAGEKTGVCPDFNQLGAALNNYDAISTLYNSLPAPLKGETPTSRVLAMVKTILTADPSPGPKYVLFVTDGEPDYCDDGNALCAIDAAVWQLQTLRSAGISTFIFGIQSKLTTVSASTLQAFANAGGGSPVAPLGTTVNDVYFQCMGVPAWTADRTAAGRQGQAPLATYQAGGANSPVYRPDPTNPTALTDLLSLTISGVKSCTFDLVDGLHVDLGQLDQVKVLVQGQTVAHDAANGWSMVSDTRLQLAGDACTLWRNPQTRSIDFQFPCGVVRSN